jgi:uncharacterized protein
MESADVAFSSGTVRLAGTIWSTAASRCDLGVVLVGGSGPADRNNGGYFDALRDALVAAGIVVLGYDKRGAGSSSGSWAPATVADLAQDVVAATRALGQHARLAARQIGLFGHSEGGWVVLRACKTSRRAFAVLNSCPTVSFLESEIYALTNTGVTVGHARALFDHLRRAARDGADASAANQILTELADVDLKAAIASVGLRLDREMWAQFRSWIDYSPESDLAALATPTLAIYGDRDPLTPVAASLRAISEHASAIAQTIVVPGADHRVQVGGRFAVGYLESITNWIRAAAPAGEN